MKVGVLADTHGLLRPRVLELLAGCERLLHAGDIGDPEILATLAGLAPVEAVRGNVDQGPELGGLPAMAAGELAGLPYRMVHRREDVAESWLADHRLVVYGHSHRPELSWHGPCLLLNPGSCGRRRFRLPLTLALLTIADGRIVPEILAVEEAGGAGANRRHS